MTRLIDADSLKYDFGEINEGQHRRWDLYVTNDALAKQPTVDAIPISFIEKKIGAIRKYLGEGEGFTFTSELVSKAITYERLIEEWREENETN